jgi:soluble calcium-activated nucleotidase 1
VGRGAEFSALELFADKLLTFCDRTGEVLEVRADVKDDGDAFEPLAGQAVEINVKVRSGPGGPPLKLEWTTQKGTQLVIGSTGRSHVNEDGSVNEDESWVAVLQDDMMGIQYINAQEHYRVLGGVLGCTALGSFASHEGCRWSQIHSMWFFMPRKIKRLKDSPVVFKPLMLAVPDTAGDELWGKWDADSIIVAEPSLPGNGKRGCSDFSFIPGTNDCHMIVLRTEEEAGQHSLITFASVIDLRGNVLMDEEKVRGHRKYEGLALFPPGTIETCPGITVRQPEEPPPSSASSIFCSCFQKAPEREQFANPASD